MPNLRNRDNKVITNDGDGNDDDNDDNCDDDDIDDDDEHFADAVAAYDNEDNLQSHTILAPGVNHLRASDFFSHSDQLYIDVVLKFKIK
ncbi:hypothetical protein ElyMa_003910400 [Elysia marginata]|uniref:Uncharacterized protein n=1 Tax=Elysia marginata TaxID=1093978 RepID=A0AAV4FP79_9GAST|nr:hypothetical protein ElyMa_003910400 [Elysia marginata]